MIDLESFLVHCPIPVTLTFPCPPCNNALTTFQDDLDYLPGIFCNNQYHFLTPWSTGSRVSLLQKGHRTFVFFQVKLLT